MLFQNLHSVTKLLINLLQRTVRNNNLCCFIPTVTIQDMNFVKLEWALCDSGNLRLCHNLHFNLFAVYVEQK